MASLKIWKTRMILAQKKRLDLPVTTLSLAQSSARTSSTHRKNHHPQGRIQSPKTSAKTSSTKSTTRNQSVVVTKTRSQTSRSSSAKSSVQASPAPSSRRSSGRESPAVPFGGGDALEEDLRRKRVKSYRREGPQWSMLVQFNTKQYEEKLARDKKIKKKQQHELGEAICAQLEERKLQRRAEAEEKVESARRILEDVEKYKEEEFRKVLETRHRNEHGRDFIQKQLVERAEKIRKERERKRIMDERTKTKLDNDARRRREAAESARIKRLHAQRRARIENEKQRIEKIERLRKEELEEIRLQKLYAESVRRQEMQRKKDLDEMSAKVAALQRVNEGVQKNQQAKRDEEDQRIRRYQEKVDRERAAELQARVDKHERAKQDMIRVVKSQLEAKKRLQKQKQQEALEYSKLIQQMQKEEQLRQKELTRQRQERKVAYKQALDAQIALRDEVPLHPDTMSAIEQKLNRTIIEECYRYED